MNVRHSVSNLIPMSVTVSQRQTLDELSTEMALPLGTIGRVLVTEVFADPLLRARVLVETTRQKGRRFSPASDRCSYQVLVDDRTYAMVADVMGSTGVRCGVVARAALIVAAADLQAFRDALRSEVRARAVAKGRAQQHYTKYVKRQDRTNHNEVQA